MKKILGIIASPRKLGNSEIMIKEICRHVDSPHELNLIRLSDLKIDPCRGCYQCLSKTCVLRDDYGVLSEALITADAIITVAPTYFLGANALLKLVLDRSMVLHSAQERLWGKPSVGIAIAGVEGMEGHTLLDVQAFLKLILTRIQGSAVVYGALPGEIFFNVENRKIAAEMGHRLLGEKQQHEGPVCTHCGGDTFRFINDSEVRCMLCSNVGAVTMVDGRLVFEMTQKPKDFFLTQAGAFAHTNWLKGMKSHFLQNKGALSNVTKDYQNLGRWIKPEKKINAQQIKDRG